MKQKCEIKSHGVKLFLSNHKSIRKLKKEYTPSNHGHKVWPSTWLLIDYLRNYSLISGQRILDIGCGWGLAGIYCARNLNATVTCVDGDEEVYPYLKLLAEINKVKINFFSMDIDKIKRNLLKNIDIAIGSDICFCDTLVDPIRRFIYRAKKASVAQIFISDPGRWPFDDLAAFFKEKRGAELIEWKTNSPVNIQGKILKLVF